MAGSRGQLRFDGMDVTLGEGKFSGGFDLDDETMDSLRLQDQVTWIVTSVLTKAGLGETKTGDLKRTNGFEVTGAKMVDPDVAVKLLQSLGGVANRDNSQMDGQLSITEDTDVGTITFGPYGDDDDV
jgi:hypothetical protein